MLPAIAFPILAEISDKMSTISEMWTRMTIVATVMVGFVCGLSWIKKRLGLIPILLSFGIGVVCYHPGNDLIQPIIDELGPEYLSHHCLSAWLPLLSTVLVWGLMIQKLPKHFQGCNE
ncbi:MAG: hypothetical protein ACKVT0_17795 [Planctomycetaceae bacterium]